MSNYIIIDYVNLTYIFFIALSLAMDAFAVAIASGIRLKNINHRQRFRLSWHFGLFQGLMLVIGWYLGFNLYSYIEKYNHWIAFGLLTFVGIHMIIDNFKNKNKKTSFYDPTKGRMLILLSFSTSIDALAVGVSMSMLEYQILLPSVIIGFVAAVFTLIGMEIGTKLSSLNRIGPYTQILAGIILIIIGTEILFDNIDFNV